jgi:hypothetical protein
MESSGRMLLQIQSLLEHWQRPGRRSLPEIAELAFAQTAISRLLKIAGFSVFGDSNSTHPASGKAWREKDLKPAPDGHCNAA